MNLKKPSQIAIESNIRNYTVVLEQSPDFMARLGDQSHCCYVVDSTVWELYRNTVLQELDPSLVITLPAEEQRKNLTTVQKIYDQLILRSAKKNITLVSIGGGIVQDITGFVASTIYRGINWIFVPTTLLAQADSCIGSKTSLNYKAFKNLIGTFFPPSEVILYTRFLLTLEKIHFYSGLGEVVKLHILGGVETFNKLHETLNQIENRSLPALTNCILSSLEIKKRFITEDEFDTGKRQFLNYGHGFGHALETASDFKIPHGQAVIIGMLLANNVARQRNILSKRAHRDIAEKLLLPSLQTKLRREYLQYTRIIEGMKHDKKRTDNRLVLIVLNDLHQMIKLTDLSETEVRYALDEFAESSKSLMVSEGL